MHGGAFWYCTYHGGLKAELFVTLLRRMMRRRTKPVHLVLDGLPAHKTALVKAYVASTNGMVTLLREVRANLVYREFTRVGAAKMPDAKTMGRWGAAMGPVVIHQIHDRIVQIARANDVVQGRRMRIDTTVVESNIHYSHRQQPIGATGSGC